LLRSFDLGTVDLPQKMDLEEYDNPSQIAKSLRLFWRIPQGPICNVIDCLENAGIVLFPIDFAGRQFSGVTTLSEDGTPIIFFNSQMPSDRSRFTLCHELGHILMHRVPNPNMESQADEFASEFLMPSEDISSSLNRITLTKLGDMKRYWKVSMQALIMRAYSLGKITDRQRKSLFMKMSASGYRLREPIELDVPRENTSLINEIIDAHMNDLGFSIDDIASTLAYHKDEFLDIYTVDTLQNRDHRNIRIVK